MKNVLTISILTCVLTFCGRNQAVDESLDRAESCMSASPDSALAILESIDSLHFDSRSQNARYALLKSIALTRTTSTGLTTRSSTLPWTIIVIAATPHTSSSLITTRPASIRTPVRWTRLWKVWFARSISDPEKFQPRIERDCISLNHRYSQIDMIILIIWFQNLNWLSLIPWKLGRLIIMCHHCWIKREHI